MKGRGRKYAHAKPFAGKETVAEEKAEDRAIKKAHSVKGAMAKARLDKKARGGHVKKFIAGAIKHPGAETRAAEHAGMTTHEYMEKHKNDSGAAGKRARLGLTLTKLAKHKHKE